MLSDAVRHAVNTSTAEVLVWNTFEKSDMQSQNIQHFLMIIPQQRIKIILNFKNRSGPH